MFIDFCFSFSSIVSADAATLELDYYTAADFTTTSTSNISRTTVELSRAPSGYAYLYTAPIGWAGTCHANTEFFTAMYENGTVELQISGSPVYIYGVY